MAKIVELHPVGGPLARIAIESAPLERSPSEAAIDESVAIGAVTDLHWAADYLTRARGKLTLLPLCDVQILLWRSADIIRQIESLAASTAISAGIAERAESL